MSSVAGAADGTRGAYNQVLEGIEAKVGKDWQCPICLLNLEELAGGDRDAIALKTSIVATSCCSGAGGAPSPHYIDKSCARTLYETKNYNCPICRASNVLAPLFNPIFFGNKDVPNDLPIDEVRQLLREGKLDLAARNAVGRTPFHIAAEYGNLPYLTAMIVSPPIK